MTLNLIYVTASSKKEALGIGKRLLEKKLAACVNVFGDMESLYFWNKTLRQAKEAVLIVKCKSENNQKIIDEITAAHSYKCPAILILPIIGGGEDYLKWLNS